MLTDDVMVVMVTSSAALSLLLLVLTWRQNATDGTKRFTQRVFTLQISSKRSPISKIFHCKILVFPVVSAPHNCTLNRKHWDCKVSLCQMTDFPMRL